MDEIAKNKSMEVDTLKEKLVASGTPGFTGATVSLEIKLGRCGVFVITELNLLTRSSGPYIC